jgi:hypothetical protein
MFRRIVSAVRRLALRFYHLLDAKKCERCPKPGCCVFVYARVRITEGTGGTSIGLRVNPLTPPAEWLCPECVPVALADFESRPPRNPNHVEPKQD